MLKEIAVVSFDAKIAVTLVPAGPVPPAGPVAPGLPCDPAAPVISLKVTKSAHAPPVTRH